MSGQYGHFSASARADDDGAGRPEVSTADAAMTLGRWLGDLQPGSLEACSFRHQVEAEPDGVGHDSGQGAYLKPDTRDPLAGQTLADCVHQALGDGQFMHGFVFPGG